MPRSTEPSSAPAEPLRKVAWVTEYLGWSEHTVRDAVRRRTIPFLKTGMGARSLDPPIHCR